MAGEQPTRYVSRRIRWSEKLFLALNRIDMELNHSFKVYPGIWIGNKGVAEDVTRLSAMGVTHLLNCAGGVSGRLLTNQKPVLLPRPMRGHVD